MRSHQIEEGHDDPCKDDQYLNMMLKGLTNQTKPLVANRKPLTLPFLSRLQEKLHGSHWSNYDKIMLWSAFTMAFYGILRVSEYTSPHQNRFTPTTLLRNDIELTKRHITICLKRDKTHQRSIPPPIILSQVESDCCPVQAMQQYLQLRPGGNNNPLFIFEAGSYLTRQRVNKVLSTLLGSGFTSHSFRIGAASSASKAGCSNEQIRVMGRWRSNVAHRYVRPDSIEIRHPMRKV